MKITGIFCPAALHLMEVPYHEKDTFKVGDNVIFKDSDAKEEHGIIKYVDKDPVDMERVVKDGKVLRPATANDLQKVESHLDQGDGALKACKELIKKMGVDMAIFHAGYSLDGGKVYFVFTADERVDFRDLVKELAKILKKQIHLRQIGPRDKAKLIGGYGRCGRALCCKTFLGRFESINMEMVRDQGLEGKGSSKLSGSCGKLLCCLRYEIEAYQDLKKDMPDIGDFVLLKKTATTPERDGMVVAIDILNRKLRVSFKGHESAIVHLSDINKVVKREKT